MTPRATTAATETPLGTGVLRVGSGLANDPGVLPVLPARQLCKILK
jgi:hypothetical protein